jgi:hypothetical protein
LGRTANSHQRPGANLRCRTARSLTNLPVSCGEENQERAVAICRCPRRKKRASALIFVAARLVIFICLAGHVHAQQPVVRTYSLNAADEDWSFLRERSRRNDFWDPLKYIQPRPEREEKLRRSTSLLRPRHMAHFRCICETGFRQSERI